MFYHYYLHLNVYVSLFLKCIIVYFYSYKNDVVVVLVCFFKLIYFLGFTAAGVAWFSDAEK